MVFAAVAAAFGAFLKLDTSLARIEARLYVVEWALGLPMGPNGAPQRPAGIMPSREAPVRP